MEVLAVDNICKSFGGLQALDHVFLKVGVGERRAVIGPNGAGKTTLFHIISGILSPTSGSIFMLGKDISLLPMYHRVNLGLSQTFQIINLFKGLTVLENAVLAIQGFKRVKHTIHRPLSSYKSLIPQAEELMEQWGLRGRRDVRVSSLSYGEQRLLDIMLAMASTPRLLLLDEPTSGLSLAEISVVISKIKDLSREITVLLIEHNMEVALDLADRVTVLNVGQVVTEGTSTQIKEDPRVKKIYLRTKKE